MKRFTLGINGQETHHDTLKEAGQQIVDFYRKPENFDVSFTFHINDNQQLKEHGTTIHGYYQAEAIIEDAKTFEMYIAMFDITQHTQGPNP